jgi:hypothetical protein
MGSHELRRPSGDQAETPSPPDMYGSAPGPLGPPPSGPAVWSADPGTAPLVNLFGTPLGTPGATQSGVFLPNGGPVRYAEPTTDFTRPAPQRRTSMGWSGMASIRVVISGVALVLAAIRLIHGSANAVNAFDNATGTATAPTYAQGQCVTVAVDDARTSTFAHVRDAPCSRSDAHVILRTGSMKGMASDEATVAAAVRKAAPALAAKGDIYWSTTQWILVDTTPAPQEGLG